MAVTYETIATTSLGSNSTSVVFSSISSAYTDLVLVIRAGTEHSNNGSRGYIQFNSDTSTSNTNYSNNYIATISTPATTSGKDVSQQFIAYGVVGNNTDNFAQFNIDIMDYNNTNKYKTILSRGSNPNASGNGSLRATVGMWRSTSAISSITLTCDSGGYRTNSVFTLYGIKAA